ncbi:polynucleotide 5'-hydroxyl-kinase NOL9-like isoform X2 [Clavelina lepadiformis]|uniref:polynucleotide 5'-hydroxyl-kinase NOL9-like isoform X2 n=1 Tax=Clavelina lepadiformis TaxID=159417 RepID=UPI004042F265
MGRKTVSTKKKNLFERKRCKTLCKLKPKSFGISEQKSKNKRSLKEKRKKLNQTSLYDVDRELEESSEITEDSSCAFDDALKDNFTETSCDEMMNDVKYSSAQESFALPKGCKVFPIDPITSSLSTVLLAIPDGVEHIKLYGKARIAALHGTCKVNGYIVKPRRELLNIHAPVTHAALVLHLLSDAAERIPGSEILALYKINISTLEETLQEFKVVLVLQHLPDNLQPSSYPGYKDLYKSRQSDATSAEELCEGCWACETSRHFKEYDCYMEASKRVMDFGQISGSYSRNQSQYPVVMTTGGKNVGKSTFNRYLINCLLNRYPHVYFLECDIGQTEFTPSGIVAVNRIDSSSPLMGPPFTHQWKPKHMCYFGGTTPSGDPDRYMDCIQFAIASLYDDLGGALDGPLVINTMGWVRALGLQLLMDTIRMAAPTHIIQFFSQLESRNCAPLTSGYLTNAEGWLSGKTSNQTFELLSLNVNTEITSGKKYVASDFRNLAMLSQLMNITRNCLTRDGREKHSLLQDLQNVRPYCIRLDSLLLCNSTDSPIKRKYAFAVLNAAVIGLCAVSDDVFVNLKQTSDNSLLPAPPTFPCLGLGLVRGVDPESGMIFIVTDLTLGLLERVNCVVFGNYSFLEPLMLQYSKMSAGYRPPYVTRNFPYETIGAGMYRVHRKFNKLSQDGKE